MPIPWNVEIAAIFWQRRQFTLLHPGADAATRIASNLQAIANKEEDYQKSLATLQSSSTEDNVTPSFTNAQKSLELWVKTLSWTFCEDCGSLMFQKLLPSFSKNKMCNDHVKCHCKDVTGEYRHMHYGYRKKTFTLRLSCSILSVEDQICNLSSQQDRDVCNAAYNYLHSSPNSSYKKYVEKREILVELGNQPNIFDMYTWAGIECALWPHLYPFTSWFESIQQG